MNTLLVLALSIATLQEVPGAAGEDRATAAALSLDVDPLVREAPNDAGLPTSPFGGWPSATSDAGNSVGPLFAEEGGPEIIGPWRIVATPDSATLLPGGDPPWQAGTFWLNVAKEFTTFDEAFTGFSLIDDGFANGDVSIVDLRFDSGVFNNDGTDLVLFEARFDAGAYAVSTDFDGFANELALPASAFHDTGEDRVYFFGANPGGSPFLAEVFAAPIDLSNLGVPEGSSINTVRMRFTDTGCDPLGLGTVEPGECLLVIGDGPGHATFLAMSHQFVTQIGPIIEDSHAVLLDVNPGFLLPTPTMTVGLSSGGIVQRVPVDGGSPSWMLDGHFAVQVLMWNPVVFPGQPEQYSAGLQVQIFPSGQVVTTPFGTPLGGLDVWAEVTTNAQGQKVLSFPFSIDGL